MVGIKYNYSWLNVFQNVCNKQDHKDATNQLLHSTRAHVGYGSVVPFALEACTPRVYVTTEPIYAMWHSCLCHNYYQEEEYSTPIHRAQEAFCQSCVGLRHKINTHYCNRNHFRYKVLAITMLAPCIFP